MRLDFALLKWFTRTHASITSVTSFSDLRPSSIGSLNAILVFAWIHCLFSLLCSSTALLPNTMDCFAMLRAAWEHVNISNQSGRYLIERMCELNEYRQHKSLWRVGLVSTLMVMLALTAIVTLDAIPPQDPREGWDKNITFWARVYIGTFILPFSTTFQLRTFVPAARLTPKQCAIRSVFGASSFLAAATLIARFWVFPYRS